MGNRDSLRLIPLIAAVIVIMGALGCPAPKTPLTRLTEDDHAAYFPIDSGPHAVACNECHTNDDTFEQFNCTACHQHEPVATDLLHETTASYAYDSPNCYSCHPGGVQRPIFDHVPGRNQCATCHDAGAAFAALPIEGFTHPETFGNDCGSCHRSVTDWANSGVPSALIGDPTTTIDVEALLPIFAGTSIVGVSADTQRLPMEMAHFDAALDPTLLANCASCHSEPSSFYPGRLHSSLENLFAPQPTSCTGCHQNAVPTGFVGPLAVDPPRDPASGEMRHDAVSWVVDAPSADLLVPQECALCHSPPALGVAATWASVAGTPAVFHDSLLNGGLPQPDSCIDCHANSRSTSTFDANNAPLPAGVVFDHNTIDAQIDCTSCHSTSVTTWTDGRFHSATAPTPVTCLPCHEQQRPTSTSTWESPTFADAPFDFVTNARGVTHGAGLDCVQCHNTAGTGVFGLNPNWQNGNFDHAVGSIADRTCIACHSTQRADLVVANSDALLGFDHATAGTGDCVGCHQATVVAGAYANLFNAQGTFPGGDWEGGVTYPGEFPIGGEDNFITVTETGLVRSGVRNFVTSTTTRTATLYDQMAHTSAALPASLNAGPSNAPNDGVCFHCHTNNNGLVTSFLGGNYHDSLDEFRATAGGALAPLPQPTSHCADCHQVPRDVVMKSGVGLQPMDHAVIFAAPATVDGRSVAGVADIDCATCHARPGDSFDDGVFHANVGAATFTDCTQCHYPTVIGTGFGGVASVDIVDAPDFAMRHASTQLPVQNCQTCHTTSLTQATQTPPATTQWSTATLHAEVTPQPGSCVECHAVSPPPALTQSTESYTLAKGGTATNGAQWMSHQARNVVGLDCVRCHRNDARANNAAWSRSTPFHAEITTGVTTCVECHGVSGTQNNLPVGRTDSTMVSSSAGAASTGIAAGTKAQITHSDLNITSHDCNFCHTQVGPSAVAATTGKEWAQANFHTRFSAATPLALNGTTARCSSCHISERPGAAYSVDHSAFSESTGVDCASCHTWPGTGSASAPNWEGAVGGVPAIIAVGGFVVPQPPAANANTIEPNIPNLPHPTVAPSTSCATCHAGGTGARGAFGYDHASPLINTKCSSCHEAGSDLVGTIWNGAATLDAGAGDTRPFTVGTMTVETAAYPGRTLDVTVENHFFPTDCYECHDGSEGALLTATTGAAYRANWNFPHDQTRMTNPTTCVACHGENGTLPADLVNDPTTSITVQTKVPQYVGTTMTAATPQTETLPMSMDHLSSSIPAAFRNNCANCHAEPTTYYPGLLHSSLANQLQPNPTTCVDCHITAVPGGFVGPDATDPPRNPASGEMKHNAVAWLADAPTNTGLVPIECSTCHVAPSEALSTTWAVGTAPANFHDSLTAAAIAQPDSCIDCHANSRPTGAAATFTRATAPSLPVGVSFDHATSAAQTDCVSCHESATYESWSDARFHTVGDADPSSCLPCHEGERPTSTSTWASPTFRNKPFDFVDNADGIGHGDGQDCVLCHQSSGTGDWGVNQNWQGGDFDHAPTTVAGTTCIACHTTQRADLIAANTATLLGFDHATAGTGDCYGCHQQTVTSGSYDNLFNPATGRLPGGDWAGGISYPGDVLIGSQTQFITLTEINLTRSGPLNLVTGTAPVQATLYNEMLHTSTALPASLNAGPSNNPDDTKCFHCHTNTNGVVTSFINGQYHSSLTTFRSTPGGAVTPLPQPTIACIDCHEQMRPTAIVEKAGATATLEPMDHDAAFSAAVTINGRSVTNVNAVECGVCHKSPGTSWADGKFHANIGAGVPADCNVCHYVTMANTATSDVSSGTTFSMKHASSQVKFQNCQTCHTQALARGSQTPLASTQWSGGVLHPKVSPQPSSCLDCHSNSDPTTTTQGSVTYVLPKGGTATNGAQWMSHTTTYVAGRDCVACHAADARTAGSAWSKAAPFHPSTLNVTTCAVCHGTANGNGAVAGTRNNLPATLTDSTMLTTASNNAATGVAAGTHDQILHTDVNVTSRDCNACHTQEGTSATPGIAGKEWAQASFHTNFNAATPLLMNNTTGRCSNCHLNVRPAAGFTVDHTAFTSATTTTDCASCHSWPGTGTAAAPNWLGAEGGFPPSISVGGFLITSPPAANATTTQTGINNLPHPTPGANACTACHTNAGGGRRAIGYDHTSTLINTKCNSCHEAGSDLVGTRWNNATAIIGAGDTRPFTITALRVTFKGNSLTVNGGNHFYPVDCYQCHNAPVGLAKTTTGATFKTAWVFPHKETRMTDPATCRLCHGNNIPR